MASSARGIWPSLGADGAALFFNTLRRAAIQAKTMCKP